MRLIDPTEGAAAVLITSNDRARREPDRVTRLPTHLELMLSHVEAEFTHDAQGCLLRVNDAGAAPAPRFFLGRTAEGSLLRFRHDLAQDARHALQAAVESHARLGQRLDVPIDP